MAGHDVVERRRHARWWISCNGVHVFELDIGRAALTTPAVRDDLARRNRIQAVRGYLAGRALLAIA
jgi:hypothetical protein